MRATQVITLEQVAIYPPDKIKFSGHVEQPQLAVEITDAHNTINVTEYIVHEYQSIIPFEGMFAGSSFWKDLPEFLEEYWRDTDETVETD